MADRNDNSQQNLPKVDRRGTSVLVPLGIGAVFVVIVVFMLMRNSMEGTPPPPIGETATQPSGAKPSPGK